MFLAHLTEASVCPTIPFLKLLATTTNAPSCFVKKMAGLTQSQRCDPQAKIPESCKDSICEMCSAKSEIGKGYY